MPLTLAQYEAIQRYLDGRMPPQEVKEFLMALEKEDALKESFLFEKELRQKLISIQEKNDLFEKVTGYCETNNNAVDDAMVKSLINKAGNEWEQEQKNFTGKEKTIIDYKPGQKKSRVFKISTWAVITAAACIAFAVVSLELFKPKSSVPLPVIANNDTAPGNKKFNNNITNIIPADSFKNLDSGNPGLSSIALFKKYYRKDTTHLPMPDMLAMVPSAYLQGNYSYLGELNLGKFPNTRGSADDLNSKQNVLQTGHYFFGLSYIETNDNKKAIENLQWVIDSALSEPLKIKANWYAGLTYIKEKNVKKAVPLLEAVSKNFGHNPYQKRAAEIVALLKDAPADH